MRSMAATERSRRWTTITASAAGTAVLLLLGASSPAAGQHARAPGAHADGPVELPLGGHGGLLHVPVHLPGGGELSFLVSTGISMTVLSESAARRIGDSEELSLGGIAVRVEGSQTVPDASLTKEGRRFDGMIGSNTLNQFDLLVDAPGGKMVLRPVGGPPDWPGVRLSSPVRLRIYHGVVVALDVELNGTRYPAMLDFGSPTLLVNERVVTEGKITGDHARSLRIGSTAYTDVPLQLSDHPVIERFSPNGDGFVIVGAPIAVDCVVSLSWVRRELRTCVR